MRCRRCAAPEHTIEAVIDRFRPREDIKQRLAESFETALKLGDGMASVQSLDSADASPTLFSSKLLLSGLRLLAAGAGTAACSVQRTDARSPAATAWAWPNLRSFARGGASRLSLAAGAVRGWDRRNALLLPLIASLAKHLRSTVDAAWNSRRPRCSSRAVRQRR